MQLWRQQFSHPIAFYRYRYCASKTIKHHINNTHSPGDYVFSSDTHHRMSFDVMVKSTTTSPGILWPYPMVQKQRKQSDLDLNFIPQVNLHKSRLHWLPEEMNLSEPCGWTTQQHPRNFGLKSKSVNDMIGKIKVAAKFGALPWIRHRKLDRCARRRFLQGLRRGSLCWSSHN
jgi:hypothetical protein